jgi:acyl-coenzyme A thioesterase PaaI-like protein
VNAAPSDTPVTIRIGGPEALLRIGELRFDADGTVSADMPIGPELRGPDGAVPVGALGVLLDDAMGYAINAAFGSWSISTDLSVEMVAGLDGVDTVRVDATVSELRDGRAYARGTVLDGAGRVLGFGSQRGRVVLESPPPAGSVPAAPAEPMGLLELFGAAVRVVDGTLEATVGPELTNPRGNLHGGMGFCLTDLAAGTALPALPVTESIRTSFVRGVPGGTVLQLHTDVAYAGRTLGVVRVDARDATGRTYLTSTVVRASTPTA